MPITRIMWCSVCYENNLPRSNYLFLIYGATRKEYFVMRTVRKGTRGMTPHICYYHGLDEKGKAKVEIICGMNGCDVLLEIDARKQAHYNIIHKKFYRMTLKNWNALQGLKNDPQFQI